METSAAWSTQQLVEFLAAVSAFETEKGAAMGAVERAAESLDAEVAALVAHGEVVASVGYHEGAAPADEFKSVSSGASRQLTIPGVGLCPATVAPLEYPPDAALVLARVEALSREEISVLQGMAHVAGITMRMLHHVGHERELRNEQEALRRVATLVARGVDQPTVLSAVADVVGREVTTIEGLHPTGDHPVQKAWRDVNVPQCGYCQAGQIMQAAALLMQNPKPSRDQIREAMAGNICRCGAYQRIENAVHLASTGV